VSTDLDMLLQEVIGEANEAEGLNQPGDDEQAISKLARALAALEADRDGWVKSYEESDKREVRARAETIEMLQRALAADSEVSRLRARVEDLERERDTEVERRMAAQRDAKREWCLVEEAHAALSSERRRRERVEGRLARVLNYGWNHGRKTLAERSIYRRAPQGHAPVFVARGRVWSRSRSRGGEGGK
jgi:hypothetical protein